MPTAQKWTFVTPPRVGAFAIFPPSPHHLVPITKPDFASMLVAFEARAAVMTGTQPQFHFLDAVHRCPMRAAQVLPSCRHRDPLAFSRPHPTDAQPGEPPQD